MAPPARSEAVRVKERLHRTPEGLPVHGFADLLTELGTLSRNRVIVGPADATASIDVLTEATPLQARALELASVSPLAE